MILDGKKIAAEIRAKIQREVQSLKGRKPGLTVVLVGEDQASKTYVNAKKKACIEAGMISNVLTFPNTVSQSDLLNVIENLNLDTNVDGILVQLPLPSHIDESIVTSFIDPKKDVDGFHPENMGKLLLGQNGGLRPCTPLGIKTLLEKSQIEIKGKHVVILGRSNIVGKPLAAMLMQKGPGCDATVTIAHSQTRNLSILIKSADILVTAIGKAKFVKKEMVKPKAVIIDVGINRENGKLVGDVDFENVKNHVSKITPVPGGVGPMTIAILLKNTLQAFSKILIFLLLFSACQESETKDPCTYFSGTAQDQNYQIVIGKKLSEKEKKKVELAISRTFLAYENLFDLKKPNSELININKAPKDVLIPLSPVMQEILELSGKIVALSSNRFDPTIEPIAKAWKACDDPDLQAPIEASGWKHISIHNGIFKKDHDRTELNLGGIAKGLCVDQLSMCLTELGIQDFLVQWAGGIRASGHHPEASDWVVQVSPNLTQDNQEMAPIPLRDTAIASSGRNVFNIIDPTTAYPIERTDFSIASATVIAPTCALADGLATAAMLFSTRKLAEKWAQEIVDSYPDVSFWIISYTDRDPILESRSVYRNEW